MKRLAGSYENRIDGKGRVSIPKPFRAFFAARGSETIYLFPSFRQPALEGCGEDFLDRLQDRIDGLDLFSDKLDDFALLTIGQAMPLSLDPEGRVTLPADLRDAIGLTDAAMFVGQGERFQIWEPSAGRAAREAAIERLRATGATLPARSGT
ncbi:MAG: division/cell wall cluster transcriptional repressor MraZ [Rhodospirillales bacterium]